MRIALIASPFIEVPPRRYGGTELFIARLAEGLTERGVRVILYANGESTVGCELRYLYPHGEWPIDGEIYSSTKDLNHTSWAIHDCWHEADIIHLNNVPGLAFARFRGPRFAYTVHHPHQPALSQFYSCFSEVEFVTISRFQQQRESFPRTRTIHHGVDMRAYKLNPRKQPYFCFLGRIAPVKGTHLAIEVARQTGIPLKIAGEIQPIFRDYFESRIKPHIDGKFIQFLGEANLAEKNELLGNATAMLFPIQWDEPFGLVMIEAMATGTPVLALSGGAVREVVADGVSGYVCSTLPELVEKARRADSAFNPLLVRRYVEENFSVEGMVNKYVTLYQDMAGGVRERLAPLASLRPAHSGELAHGAASEGIAARLASTRLVHGDEQEQLPPEPEEPRAIA
ncbi:MAG: glycosyltransferase family 4 protein [Candidatus Korobacteraceae bacterium]|jgi:glycosyltransferase involved in cell wall biosynthesis